MEEVIYIVYGITDCPWCLRACADLMEHDKEYVFVQTDFSKSFRKRLMREKGWRSFPIVVEVPFDSEAPFTLGQRLIGGSTELKDHLVALTECGNGV